MTVRAVTTALTATAARTAVRVARTAVTAFSKLNDARRAQEMLEKLTGQDPSRAYVSTLAVEREINTFFRLTSPSVIARLRDAFPDLPEKPDARTVFLKLRELRNRW